MHASPNETPWRRVGRIAGHPAGAQSSSASTPFASRALTTRRGRPSKPPTTAIASSTRRRRRAGRQIPRLVVQAPEPVHRSEFSRMLGSEVLRDAGLGMVSSIRVRPALIGCGRGGGAPRGGPARSTRSRLETVASASSEVAGREWGRPTRFDRFGYFSGTHAPFAQGRAIARAYERNTRRKRPCRPERKVILSPVPREET